MKLDYDSYEMVQSLIGAYWDQNPAGGSLHIVLEDGNWDRGSIEFCLNYSIGKQDWAGALISDLLLQLSDERIAFLDDHPHEWRNVIAWQAMGIPV